MASYKTNPARQLRAFTPSDVTEFQETRSVYIGIDGDITVDAVDLGTNITFKNAVAGTYKPIAITKIYATGTAGGAGDYIGLN